jgi:hypothetical protein
LDHSVGPDWKSVEEAFGRARELLRQHLGPGPAEQVLKNLRLVRESPGITPALMLQTILSWVDAFGQARPPTPPFSLAQCRGLKEAAPRRLTEVRQRMALKRPPRGIDEVDREALSVHADALVETFSHLPGDGAAFAVQVAFQNSLSYGHHFIWGQNRPRRDSEGLFELAEAYARIDPGAEYVPVILVPGEGVICATRGPPPERLDQAWEVLGFVFFPFSNLERLHLHHEGELAEFFRRHPLPLTPDHLAVILAVLLSPFPWSSRIEKVEGLPIRRFADLEDERSDPLHTSGAASTLLGVEKSPANLEAPEVGLVLQDPPGFVGVNNDGVFFDR